MTAHDTAAPGDHRKRNGIILGAAGLAVCRRLGDRVRDRLRN